MLKHENENDASEDDYELDDKLLHMCLSCKSNNV